MKLPGCVIFANALHTYAFSILRESDPGIHPLEVCMIVNHVTMLKSLNKVEESKHRTDQHLSKWRSQ